MTRWLWYANAAIVGLAALVLIIGLSGVGGIPRSAKEQLSGRGSRQNGGGSSDGGEDGPVEDSPLVAAARSYSKRWQPKPPPKKIDPPTFVVGEVLVGEEGKARGVQITPTGSEEMGEYGVGDVVDGYAIEGIELVELSVSKEGQRFD